MTDEENLRRACRLLGLTQVERIVKAIGKRANAEFAAVLDALADL